jgi:uncharacterized cupin superfamily protein
VNITAPEKHVRTLELTLQIREERQGSGKLTNPSMEALPGGGQSRQCQLGHSKTGSWPATTGRARVSTRRPWFARCLSGDSEGPGENSRTAGPALTDLREGFCFRFGHVSFSLQTQPSCG